MYISRRISHKAPAIARRSPITIARRFNASDASTNNLRYSLLTKNSDEFKDLCSPLRVVPIDSIPQTAAHENLLTKLAAQPVEYPYTQVEPVTDQKSKDAYIKAFKLLVCSYHECKYISPFKGLAIVSLLTLLSPYHLATFAVSFTVFAANYYKIRRNHHTLTRFYYGRNPAPIVPLMPLYDSVSNGVTSAKSAALTGEKFLFKFYSMILARGYDLYRDVAKVVYTHATSAEFFQDKFLGPPFLRIPAKNLPKGLIDEPVPCGISIIDAPVTRTQIDVTGKPHPIEYFAEMEIPFFPSVLSDAETVRLNSAFNVADHERATITEEFQRNVEEGKKVGFHYATDEVTDNFVIRQGRVQSDFVRSLAMGRVIVKLSSGFAGSDGTLSPFVPWITDSIRIEYTDKSGNYYEANVDRVVGRTGEPEPDHPILTGAAADSVAEYMRKLQPQVHAHEEKLRKADQARRDKANESK